LDFPETGPETSTASPYSLFYEPQRPNTQEAAVLAIIQQRYGAQNDVDAVFLTDTNEAVIFVKESAHPD
jgi:hypothetical protein